MAVEDTPQPTPPADDTPQPAPEADATPEAQPTTPDDAIAADAPADDAQPTDAPPAEVPADDTAPADVPSVDATTADTAPDNAPQAVAAPADAIPVEESQADMPADNVPLADTSPTDTTPNDTALADAAPMADIAAQETAEQAAVVDEVPSAPALPDQITVGQPEADETTAVLPVAEQATVVLPAIEQTTIPLPVVEQPTVVLPAAERETPAPATPPEETTTPLAAIEASAPAPIVHEPAPTIMELAPAMVEPAPRLLLPTVVAPLPPLAPDTWKPRSRLRIAAIVAMLLLLPVVVAGTLLQLRASNATGISIAVTAQPTLATTGPLQWGNDSQKTSPDPQFGVFATQKNPVDPAFQQYYAQHNGATLLGTALTPGYATEGGWIQIFTDGALLKPTPDTDKATPTPGDLSAQVIGEGSTDAATGVVRVPLLHSLLTVGSALTIGGTNSSVSYVSLRQATVANMQVSMPVWRAEHGDTSANAVFIAERQADGQAFGHLIPLPIWAYINRADVAPDGWEAAFGQPITEALATTVVRDGTVHHLLVQAFWLGAVEVDTDALDADDQPTVRLVPTGADYLRTLGPPTVAITAGAGAWATGNLAVVSTPGSSSAAVHLGANFPVTLTGQTRWLNGALWYSVSWKSVSRSGTGWAPGSAITRTTPSVNALQYASFDALSPDVARYLAGFGNNVGSVIYDITRGQYYTYNPNTAFTLASSSKVSIMMAYLDMVESQGRGLNSQENYEITIMIQHSDNNAAQWLYDRLGDGSGMTAWMQKVGVHGYQANPAGWGWGMLPPTGQVQLLTMLQKGQILTASDRSYALGLMKTVESDQRNGVGDTLPSGASVAMKDGWVPEPDGLWAVNTSGIVTAGSETYIIVVYSEHQPNENAGWTIARYVCSHVGKLLVS